MKKGLILSVMLAGAAALGFSQTAWTVSNAASWVEAVNGIRNGGNSKAHTITVSGTVSVIPTPASENTFGSVTGVTVTIQSPGNGIITLNSNGSLLRIGSGQTVVVKDLTLKGRSDNKAPMVFVGDRGSFRMEGKAVVSGNTREHDRASWEREEGGGIYVSNGIFTMQDNATVSDNKADIGGGVYVSGGTFTLKDNASVSGNIGNVGGEGGGGGGVYIANGTFTMQGSAAVSGNTSYGSGGGIYNRGTFTMQGSAAISRNSNATQVSVGGGGGIYNAGTFTMQGNATVSGNTSSISNGAGIYVDSAGEFTMQDNVKVSGNQANNGSGGGVYVSGMNRGYRSVEHVSGVFIMKGNASVSGNTSRDGGGVCIEGGTFTIQDNATVSGNTAANNGGGLSIGERDKDFTVFTKKSGTIYGNNETNAQLRNNAKQGSAIYGANQWRNATAGPTMNTGTFGFWLNEEEVVQSNTASPPSGNVTSSPSDNAALRPPDVTAFPASFRGTWRKKSGPFNKITIDANSIKVNFTGTLLLITGSGDSYKVRTEKGNQTVTLNIKFVKGNLEISCNDNLAYPWNTWDWNDTLQKQ